MILCCGEALIDMLPRKGVDGTDVYQPFNGGSVYNTAIALGRLGTKTGLFCGVSRDFFGDGIVAALAAAGVSTRFLKRKDRHTTLALVKLSDGHARYSFIDEGSAGRMLEKSDIPALPRQVSALHFGSISLIPEPCGSTYETLLKRNAGARVISLDPNIRPTVITDRKKHLARLSRLIALADIVKVSDEDVAWMTGRKGIPATARAWLRSGARLVAVTRGASGVDVFTRQHTLSVAAPKVKVADTVGAGDTFTAGLLTQLNGKGLLTKKAIAALTEAELEAAAAFAMKCAAVTVSRPGADPPWAGEVA